MSTPHESDDEGHIADTGMFKRFVEHEQEIDASGSSGASKGLWIAIGAIVLIIIVAVIIWTLTR